MNRRELLTGTAAIALVGKFVSGPIASKTAVELSATSGQWLQEWGHRLPAISRVQAQAKSHESNIPRNTLYGSPWHYDVTLLSYRARGANPHEALKIVESIVSEQGWPTFAAGWSHDRSTWAKFVMTDVRALQEAVSGKLDALISIPAAVAQRA